MILDKALTANRAREAARKARESIRRKTALGGAAMPDKLRDCNENNPELTEIYIVEGDTRRRLRHPGPRLPLPGHPPPVGQDAERGEGPGRQGLRQRQAAARDHGAGRRHRRRVRRRQAALSQSGHHGRCRCGRLPYPHPAAHLLLPLHAPADRAGLCVFRRAAAV